MGDFHNDIILITTTTRILWVFLFLFEFCNPGEV